jgi:hypothetical protein
MERNRKGSADAKGRSAGLVYVRKRFAGKSLHDAAKADPINRDSCPEMGWHPLKQSSQVSFQTQFREGSLIAAVISSTSGRPALHHVDT